MNLQEIFDASKCDPEDVMLYIKRGHLPFSDEDKLSLQNEAGFSAETSQKVVSFCLLMRAGFRLEAARDYVWHKRKPSDLFDAIEALATLPRE